MGAGTAYAAGSVDRSRRLPREVWIASITQCRTGKTPGETIDNFIARMEEAATMQPDIICLPEVGPFVDLPAKRSAVEAVAETPPGPFTERFAEFARAHHCYVWCPLYTKEGDRLYNALVLLDRQGRVAGEYRKRHPTDGEIEQNGLTPGSHPPVFQTDFGTIGAQICYDIEWLDGWQRLHDAGAEIVFWSSAFGGGEKLNLLATLFRYVVVSSTRKGVSRISDVDGRTLAWTGSWDSWLCAPVNLEKAFLHTWPGVRKFRDIRKKYGQAVRFTTHHDEEWSIIESLAPDVKVADVLKEFDLQTYDEMVRTSTAIQNKYRPS